MKKRKSKKQKPMRKNPRNCIKDIEEIATITFNALKYNQNINESETRRIYDLALRCIDDNK